MSPNLIIREASTSDVNLISPLFDKYRQFYKCESNIERASKYLEARVTKKESITWEAIIQDLKKHS